MQILKICKKHGELSANNLYFRKNRNYYECLFCKRESNYKFRHKDIEEIRRKEREYWQKNKYKKYLKDKKYREKNKIVLAEKKKEWKNKYLSIPGNKEKYLQKQRFWLREDYKNDPDKYRIQRQELRNYFKKYKSKLIENISDLYVKELITRVYKIPRKNIPKDLIDIHRTLLKLKRKLRELKNGDKKC